MELTSKIARFFRRRKSTDEQSSSNRQKSAAVQLISSRRGKISRDFQPPDIDIERVDEVYNSEAFARRAIDKHIELMFKAGWDFIGDDEKAIEYIRKRLYLIAEMTKIPTSQLFVEIAEDLVKYSNAVVVKVRSNRPLWPANIKIAGINNRPPVCGYFPVNLRYVETERDAAGNVYRWRINFPDVPKPLELPPEDVVHFYYKREKNRVFATPYLIAVIEDINALRQVEEGVLKLIYRFLYPFLHHIVGLEKDGYGGTDEEVQQVKQMIEQMDLEAGLVTTERHKINPVSLDQVVDAYNYLRYFEQRVFTGLGVSETVMGRSGSASRATAESQYFDLRETVKAVQRIMETFVNEFILKELLMEGGYDALFKPQTDISFRFREIDLDMKIKHENHVIYQYITNCITEDEMRAELGRNLISDRAKLFYNLVTIPVSQATGKSVAVSPGDVINRSNPTNQPKPAGKPGRPSKKSEWSDLLLDICYHASTVCSGEPIQGEVIAKANREAVAMAMLGAEVNVDAVVREALTVVQADK